MPTESISELTNQLDRVRITRQRVLQQIVLASEEGVALLVRIERERERAVRTINAATTVNNNDGDNDGDNTT